VQELIFIPQHVFLGTEADMAEIAAAFRKVQAHYASGSVAVGPAPAPHQAAAPAPVFSSPAPAEPAARPIRFGILGLGSMGRNHADAITANPRLALRAAADVLPEAGRSAAEKYGCRWFPSPEELIHSGEVDGVVIATPHWQHGELAVAALRAGLHVLCEKPLT